MTASLEGLQKSNEDLESNGDEREPVRRIKERELISWVKYADESRFILMDALRSIPDAMIPAPLALAMIESCTASIHVSHAPDLRPYHDAIWKERFGEARTYPGQGSGE